MNNTKSFKHSAWVIRTKFRTVLNGFFSLLSRKIRVFYRKFKTPRADTQTNKEPYMFAILCIKKSIYADLVVRQANSLHYFNPTHTFVVYADDICADALEKNRGKFDYPNQITVKRAFGVATLPWQIYKINMRIENARLGGIDIDADMVWHDDPVIDRTRPVMFAPARIFNENPAETAVILQIFKKPEWLSFTHFVSAFVSIPPKFMTEKLGEDARYCVKMMLENPLTFVPEQSERDEIHRCSEEIGICFALQSNYPGLTQPFKRDGGRKNKQVLEPIYYGSENRVID